jgi:hypothetical protein
MKFMIQWFYQNDAGKEFLSSVDLPEFPTRRDMTTWVEAQSKLRMSAPEFHVYRIDVYAEYEDEPEASYYPARQTWSLLTKALPEDILDKLREST